jgi:kynurenine formamidase
MNKFIDLTLPISDSMPAYPSDEAPRLEKIKDYAIDGFCNYKLSAGMHIGTHIDGPMHLTESGQFINELHLDRFVGKGCFINAIGEKIITNKPQYQSLIPEESIVVIYTGHSQKFGTEDYYNNYPVIDKKLAELFVEKNIKLLCLDSPSPDRHPHDIHKLLLTNNILIAENLASVDKLVGMKEFEVIALPLNIKSDSSPARIVARILQ